MLNPWSEARIGDYTVVYLELLVDDEGKLGVIVRLFIPPNLPGRGHADPS